MVCIDDLPNEMLNRIFENLDIKSFISFGLTSRKYFHYLENYDVHQLDFQSISKKDFDRICHLIKPSKIISLKLSDDHRTAGQIKLFLQTVPIKNFTRLKSLELLQIDENDLDQFLQNLPRTCLNSLRIEYREYPSLLHSSTISNLQEILRLKSMRKIHWDFRSDQRDYFQWPSSTHLTDLTLMNISFEQLLGIIQKFNEYQSITLDNLTMKSSETIPVKFLCLEKLKSFQIYRSELILEKIQSLISVMNQLTHLNLQGNIKSLENFFENLLRRNLLKLRSFQFDFQWISHRSIEYQSIIQSFLKHFEEFYWKVHLKCLVNADWIEENCQIDLYSIPPLNNHCKSSHFFLESFTELSRFDFISHLDIQLEHLKQMISSPIRLKSLKCQMNESCPSNSFEILSKLIDQNSLIQLNLMINSRGLYLKQMLKDYLRFLVECSNVEDVSIFNRCHGIFPYLDIHSFCSSISKKMKYLSIDIRDGNDIQMLIKRLKYLQSLQFKFSFEKSIFIKEILHWLNNENINYRSLSDIHYLSIWISQ